MASGGIRGVVAHFPDGLIKKKAYYYVPPCLKKAGYTIDTQARTFTIIQNVQYINHAQLCTLKTSNFVSFRSDLLMSCLGLVLVLNDEILDFLFVLSLLTSVSILKILMVINEHCKILNTYRQEQI